MSGGGLRVHSVRVTAVIKTRVIVIGVISRCLVIIDVVVINALLIRTEGDSRRGWRLVMILAALFHVSALGVSDD